MNHLYSMPVAGEVVLVASSVPGIPAGTFAIISGNVDEIRDSVTICLTNQAYFDDVVVQGKDEYQECIGTNDLVLTDRTIVRSFWRWKDSIPGPGRGEVFQREVRVWEWVPEKASAITERSLDTWRFWRDNAPWMPVAQDACRVLGLPVIPAFNSNIRGMLNQSLSEPIKKTVEWVCNVGGINGLSDPMYIANAIALELGIGNGRGSFYDNAKPKLNGVDAAANVIMSSYVCNLSQKTTRSKIAQVIHSYIVERKEVLTV